MSTLAQGLTKPSRDLHKIELVGIGGTVTGAGVCGWPWNAPLTIPWLPLPDQISTNLPSGYD